MKKGRTKETMRREYDFSKGVRGKYAEKYARGTNLIRIERDVQDVFPDSKSVNEALRALAKVIRSRSA